MILAPIVLFAYNRPNHLMQTISALEKNYLASESDLHIFSDNGDDVYETRRLIKWVEATNGFKSVTTHFRKEHLGLRVSVMSGVSQVLLEHDKIIVVEDDLITSRTFLTYMNDCLDYFEPDNNIGSITGYNAVKLPDGYDKDIYLSPRPGSWGWATWADRWNDFLVSTYTATIRDKKHFNIGGDDLYGMLKRARRSHIDSWAIEWAFHHYRSGLYCVYPRESKVQNIGFGCGTNCKNRTTKYDVELSDNSTKIVDVYPTEETTKAFKDLYRYSMFKKLKVLIYDLFVCPILRRLA
jgi:glycosyltransferase involved in cell wall biosynthesis